MEKTLPPKFSTTQRVFCTSYISLEYSPIQVLLDHVSCVFPGLVVDVANTVLGQAGHRASWTIPSPSISPGRRFSGTWRNLDSPLKGLLPLRALRPGSTTPGPAGRPASWLGLIKTNPLMSQGKNDYVFTKLCFKHTKTCHMSTQKFLDFVVFHLKCAST